MGYAEDGKRRRRKVSGQTKAAVVDKLRELHKALDKGIVPKTGYVRYTVRPAAEDWLAHGLDGRSAKTIKKNQNVLEPILKVAGTRSFASCRPPSAAGAGARWLPGTPARGGGDDGTPRAEARHPARRSQQPGQP